MDKKKHSVVFLLCSCVMLVAALVIYNTNLSLAFINTHANATLNGDINNDGVVDTTDAVIINQYLTGRITGYSEFVLDVVQDDVVNQIDSVEVLKIYAESMLG